MSLKDKNFTNFYHQCFCPFATLIASGCWILAPSWCIIWCTQSWASGHDTFRFPETSGRHFQGDVYPEPILLIPISQYFGKHDPPTRHPSMITLYWGPKNTTVVMPRSQLYLCTVMDSASSFHFLSWKYDASYNASSRTGSLWGPYKKNQDLLPGDLWHKVIPTRLGVLVQYFNENVVISLSL